jgi:LmbE family N-acetylglucosaminyl deacetylase
MNWLETLIAGQSLVWPEQPLPGTGKALAVAPHPDDPEAIAVTLNLLKQGGWDLYWAILTTAWSGVRDDFAGSSSQPGSSEREFAHLVLRGSDPPSTPSHLDPSQSKKAHIREAEQWEAARRFGLPEQHLSFLKLAEDAKGHMTESEQNRNQLFSFLSQLSPDLVLLPAPEDTNATHRLTYRWFSEWASLAKHKVVALGNEDPKTLSFRADLQIHFGSQTAAWKARLLECHHSQSQRNLATRGITFAERILKVNSACPGLPPGTFAERFQVRYWP